MRTCAHAHPHPPAVIGPCSGRRHCHSKRRVIGGSDGVADRAACERRLVEYSRTFYGASAAQHGALWHFARWPLKCHACRHA